jgi:serine/threonine-protein phosphatase 5
LSQDLLETYKGQGKLHRRYAFQILLDILQYFTSQPTLVDVTIPHGTYYIITYSITAF